MAREEEGARPRARDAIRNGVPLAFTSLLFLALVLVVVVHGRDEAARGDRVLSALDPAVNAFRAGAAPAVLWLYARRAILAALTTLFLAATSAAALLGGGRRGMPFLFLSGAAAIAVWAEILLLGGFRAGGSVLFAAAVVTALASTRGLSFPRTPEIPPATAALPTRGWRAPGWTESLGIFALSVLALATRVWAINQLPSNFDEEMISVQTQSRTAHGLRVFAATEFVGTSNGLATPATNRLVFAALGVSLYATRVTALVWGLAAVPLFWAFVRRLTGGTLAPLGATLLLVCAPEQLFWSRSEVSVFAPVAAVGLLFAHAGLSMVARFGALPVLFAACLTPFCRLFYTAAHVLFVYPVLLAGHAALFARGLRARALRALPVLLGGVVLWVASVSIVVAAAGGGRRFVDPARVRGESAWRAGFPPDASAAEVLRGQSTRVATNLASVFAALTFHQEYATHWYERFVAVRERDPMVCSGLTILAALGLGCLLARAAEPRAVLILFWLGLGFLPGVLSGEPDARRLSLIFVPVLLLAATFLTEWVRAAKDAGGRLAGRLAFAGAGAALLGVSAAGLAANLLLPVRPLVRDQQIRFARPFVERSDVVLHNLFYRSGKTLEFGFLDRLLSPSGPCMQFVDRGDELLSLLRPSCDFREDVYGLTLTRGQIDEKRRTQGAARVSYLFRDVPPARQAVSLLPAIDPSARVVAQEWSSLGEKLFAFEVDSRALRVATNPEVSPSGVRGGFLVPKPAWYRVILDSPCPGARILAGASGWNGEDERPLLPGLFPFEIEGPRGCSGLARPLLLQSDADGPYAPALTSPALALFPGTSGIEPMRFPGWPRARTVLGSTERIADFGVDREGRFYALLLREQAWEVRLYSKDGVELKRVRAELPLDASTGTLVVAPEGGCVAFSLRAFERFDRNLARVSRRELPERLAGSHVAELPDGRLLVVSDGALLVLGTDGRVESSWGPRGRSAGRFDAPVAVALGGDRLAVVEEAGEVNVFAVSEDPFSLRPEGRFALSFAREPHPEYLRGAAFDGPRLLVPYSPDEAPLIVDLHGDRFMAASARADLRRPELPSPYRFAHGRAELFVLDGSGARILGLTPGEAP